MKKVNRKRLDNKGFTLIELLAVVVILAVVMGIATTSVLSAMNKSRGGSLEDSAMVIASAFNQKYTESLVGGVPTDVYGDILGTGAGYNFSSSSTYLLSSKLADTFSISTSAYALSDATTQITDATAQTNSFVNFNASTGKFIVCLVANSTGSYFVDSYKLGVDTAVQSVVLSSSTDSTTGTTTYTYATVKSGMMFACSDGTKSW